MDVPRERRGRKSSSLVGLAQAACWMGTGGILLNSKDVDNSHPGPGGLRLACLRAGSFEVLARALVVWAWLWAWPHRHLAG